MALSAAHTRGWISHPRIEATSRLKCRHWAQDCHRLLHKRFDQVD
jgi:hypothetical protein